MGVRIVLKDDTFLGVIVRMKEAPHILFYPAYNYGCPVVRGPDWSWPGYQDAYGNHRGLLLYPGSRSVRTETITDNFYYVAWMDSSSKQVSHVNQYRITGSTSLLLDLLPKDPIYTAQLYHKVCRSEVIVEVDPLTYPLMNIKCKDVLIKELLNRTGDTAGDALGGKYYSYLESILQR